MTQAIGTIVVLGTGGTIAAHANAPGVAIGYAAGEVGIEALVLGLAPPGVLVETEQVAQLDSRDMDALTWRRLSVRAAHHAARPEVAGIVVTHGTDTLEETAWWLARTVVTGKPIVLTGAMRPATARSPDGPQNLADAIATAATLGARGVVAVLAGRIHAARHVRKVHPYQVDAFSSADQGPTGLVEEGHVRQVREWPECCASRLDPSAFQAATPWPWVEIVTSTAAADGRGVTSLVDAGVDGIVVATTGNGQIHEALRAALGEAERREVRVLRSLRGGMGGTIVEVRDGAAERDVVGESAGDLSPVKARVELIVRLLHKNCVL